MKKILMIAGALMMIGVSQSAHAQAVEKTEKAIEKGAKKTGHAVKKGAQKTGHAVAKGAKKTGNKTAEVASKGKAKVTDKVYQYKVGPNGETIYIDGNSRYYWIDKKGRKHYVNEASLKVKPNN